MFLKMIDSDSSQEFIKSNQSEAKSNKTDQNLFFHTVQLSNLLKSMKIYDISSKFHSSKDLQEIFQNINNIITDLRNIGKDPKIDIEENGSIFDAYSVMCYALLILCRTSIKSKFDVSQEIENEKLKERIKTLEKQINSSEEISSAEVNISQESIKKQKEIGIKKVPEYHYDNDTRFLLETEMQTLQVKYEGLEKENNKRREKINKLKLENFELNSQLDEKNQLIQRLKISNDKLTIENEELLINSNQENKEEFEKIFQQTISKQREENEKLQKALQIIEKHLEETISNFKIETESKLQLFNLMQQQSSCLYEYERLYQGFQEQITDSEKALKSLQLNCEELKGKVAKKQKCEHLEIIDTLLCYFSSKPIQNDLSSIISDILKEPNEPAITKIVEILEVFMKKYQNLKDELNQAKIQLAEIPNYQNLERMNIRLSQYCRGMIQFFEKLATSGEMQSWMIDQPCNDDLRPLLIAQCNRLEMFLGQNNDFVDIVDSFTSFPARVEDLVRENEMNNEEYLLILQLCATANDALRRCADHVCDSNHHLSNDIKTLRYELKQISNDNQIKLEGITQSMQKKIDQQERALNESKQIICQIKDELESQKHHKLAVKRSLGIINNENLDLISKQYEEEKNEKKNNNNLKKSEQESDFHELSLQIDELNKEKDFLMNQNQQRLNQINEMQQEKYNLASQNDILKDTLSKISQKYKKITENYELSQAKVEDLKKTIQDQNEKLSILSELESKQPAYDKEIYSLSEEIKSLKVQNDKISNSFQEEREQLKQELANQEKKFTNELKVYQQKETELKLYYDPILNDLRVKLNDSHEKEKQYIKTIQDADENSKKLYSELSNIRIDLKMSKLKIDAMEEKMQREKNLIETQCHMKILNMQTAHQSEKEKIQTEFRCKNQELLMNLCQRFKEYVDFSNKITEETIFGVIDKVFLEITQLRDLNNKLEGSYTELRNIMVLIGCENKKKVIETIANFVKKVHKYDIIKKEKTKLKQRISEMTDPSPTVKAPSYGDATIYEWEQWAKKVSALISDNFLSLRSAKELMFSIEEALVSSIGQRLTIKRLEMLRIEKMIYKSGILDKANALKTPYITINTIILLISAIRRMQTISGHLPCDISHFESGNSTLPNNFSGSQSERKNFPIISYEK